MFLRIVGIASVTVHGGGGRGRLPVVLIIKNYVVLVCRKNDLLHSVFFYFNSAELLQPLSSVFKMEIFDWSAG